MEEGKLTSMLEGLKAGKKKEEKNEDKDTSPEGEVVNNILEYIHMKDGGHFRYGMGFLASQVKDALH